MKTTIKLILGLILILSLGCKKEKEIVNYKYEVVFSHRDTADIVYYDNNIMYIDKIVNDYWVKSFKQNYPTLRYVNIHVISIGDTFSINIIKDDILLYTKQCVNTGEVKAQL